MFVQIDSVEFLVNESVSICDKYLEYNTIEVTNSFDSIFFIVHQVKHSKLHYTLDRLKLMNEPPIWQDEILQTDSIKYSI